MTAKGIELRELHFRIGDFALQNLSLEVHQGEYFVLTGPNGSGKTLLIRLIAGLYQPTAGSIRLAGRDLTQVPPWERAVGYVPQDGVLFPNLTVRDNIRFGPQAQNLPPAEIDRRVDEVTDMLGIQHLLNRRVEGLSGGEAQKISLSRALASGPSVLLLDEPVSAIDEETRDALCRRLREIHQQMNLPTLHVSHNSRETLLVADRVGIIRQGEMGSVVPADRFAGTTTELSGALPE